MYYLVTYLETVFSVIKHGKLSNLIKNEILVCADTIQTSFTEEINLLEHTFILELDIPATSNNFENFLFLEAINPSTIKRIIVYSHQGANILNTLFNNEFSKIISIQPAVYPLTSPLSKKRPYNEVLQETKITDSPLYGFPAKKIKLLTPVTSPNKTPISSQTPTSSKASEKLFDRIATYAEHLELLKFAFNNAKKNILITSFNVNHESLFAAYLYSLIPKAVERGVKIYIYLNDQYELENRVARFFSKHDIFCEEAYTHSKILAVDNNLIVTGSFNWLSSINSEYPESDEGSLVIRGEICEDLVQEFWKFIKYYRHRQFDNKKALYQFAKDDNNTGCIIYDLDDANKLVYLPTLEQHCAFLQDCFMAAKKQLIICSPFISSIGEYADDLVPELLKETVDKGVNIFFVCSAASKALPAFRDYLAKINSPLIHVVVTNNFHLKTIIVDDNMIAEGSFNWLSASREEDSDYHNHEQTLLVEGSMAKRLIEKFFQSPTGLVVRNAINQVLPNKHSVSFFRTTLQSVATSSQVADEPMAIEDFDEIVATALSRKTSSQN